MLFNDISKKSTICPIIQLNSAPGSVHGHINDRLLTMLSITRTSSLNFHFLLWSYMKRIIKFVFIWISNCKLHNKMNHVILESENSFSYILMILHTLFWTYQYIYSFVKCFCILMKLNNPKCIIPRNVKWRKENEQYRSPDAWFSVDVVLALVVSENDKKQ